VSAMEFSAVVASAVSPLSLQDDILADCARSDNQTCQTCRHSCDVANVLSTKQPFWDQPVVLNDKALVEASFNSTHHWASFLAASSPHSGV